MATRRTLAILPRDLIDALCSLPALASLAGSGRLLTILGTEDQMAVFDPSLLQWRMARHPEHLALPLSVLRGADAAGTLAKLKLDEAVVLAGSWRDVNLARKAGIARQWGYRGGLAGLRLSDGVAKSNAADHRTEDARALITAMGLSWSPEPLHIPETWARVGRERLQKARIQPEDGPIVGIYVGHHGPREWAWPADSFEQLVQRLRRQNPARQFVVLADDACLWLSVLLHEKTGKVHPVIGPDLTYDGLAAVLGHLDLLIACESPMLHLGALVGTPTLGLFARDPHRLAPRGNGHTQLERSPLRKLSVDEVVAACESRLD